MKKHLFAIAAVTVIAAACHEKELSSPDSLPGGKFTIQAAITAGEAQEETRTSLDIGGGTYKVAWDADDCLSVIAMYEDGTARAYQFSKGEGNEFSCEGVENPSSITRLNVFYPYDKNNYAMDGDYGRAGLNFGMNGTQAGADDTGHIDGPLYGTADVTGGAAESVTMAHASTLFDIQVTNTGDFATDVTKIRLSTGDNTIFLMGWFLINPQDGTLKASSSVYNNAELTVTDGTLAAGGTGHFYITTAPFSMPSGSVLTVTVTASGRDYSVEKKLDGDKNFRAGTVNHITDVAFAPVESISISPSYIAPATASGEFSIAVTSGSAWTVTPDAGTEGWLSVDKTSGTGNDEVTVTLSALENDSDVKTGTVRFATKDVEAVLTVQHGYAQEIGGLVWAKANVGEPDRFALAPDDPGLLYQYGSKVGWTRENPDSAPEGMPLGDKSGPATWSGENDPCPDGWRVPSREEVEALAGASHDAVTFGWVESTASGFSVNGAVLGLDNATAKTATAADMKGGIFLPCAGNRNKTHGKYQNENTAGMTTSTRTNSNNWDRFKLTINSDTDYVLPGDNWGWDGTNGAWPVRCVADVN